MTSSRPYLLRAMYEWITDNGLTPHVVIDATQQGVKVPRQSVKHGQVVLNLAMCAVANLELGNDCIEFQARFSGVSHQVHVPVQAVLALYAQENGQGMMFADENEDDHGEDPPSDEPPPSPPGPGANRNRPPRKTAHLRVVK